MLTNLTIDNAPCRFNEAGKDDVWQALKKHPGNWSDDKESHAMFWVPEGHGSTRVRPVYISKGGVGAVPWGFTLRALDHGAAIVVKTAVQATYYIVVNCKPLTFFFNVRAGI